MKKRYLALILAVAVLVLGLVACGQAQNQEEQQDPQNLDVKQTEPVDTAEPVESDTQDEPEETQAPEDETPANRSQQRQPEDNTISGDELLAIFQYAYDFGKDPMMSEENRLDSELIFIETFAKSNMPGKQLPEDYIERYIDWRPMEGEESLFEDCNETVYATGTVNIREETSTSSTKLGSLNKGDSITRIGIGLTGTTAEGWSKVQLSDGTIAYMVSSYLSTTKPSTGGGNGGGSGSGSGGGSGGGSQQGGGGSGGGSGSGGSGSGGLHGDYPDHLGGDGSDIGDPSEWNNGYNGIGWGSMGDAGEGVHGN